MMTPKPPGCQGCSLYRDGMGFVAGVYPPGAIVKLIGQIPDAEDEAAGEPFAGKVGQSLKKNYLPILGFEMSEVARDNVLRCRWQPQGKRLKTNDYPTGKDLTIALEYCRQYDVNPPEIKLILLMGTKTLDRFYPDLKASDWVGFLLPEKDTE